MQIHRNIYMYRMFILFIYLFSFIHLNANECTAESSSIDYPSDIFSEIMQKYQHHKHKDDSYLVAVEAYAPSGCSSKELIHAEKIIWEIYPGDYPYRISVRVIDDIEHHLLYWHHYEYNKGQLCKINEHEGEYPLIKRLPFGTIFEEAIDSVEVHQEELYDDIGLRVFVVHQLFNHFDEAFIKEYLLGTEGYVVILKYASLHQTGPSDDDEVHILPIEDGDEMHILPIDDGDEMHILPIEELSDKDPYLSEEHVAPRKDFWTQAEEIRKDLSYSNHVKEELDGVLHQFFGQTFLKLFGYYQHEAESGTYGSNPEVDNVRITLINGILNIRDDLALNLHQLSSTHGNARIHYVFRPSRGWLSDISSCAKVKAGYVSNQAKLLAEKWKELIKEMGGTKGGGKILHYAHSIGGSDTYAAKGLMTPEEQKMIYVTTIGSPTMIPNEGFARVVNYASVRDGVCLFDPISYMGKMIYSGSSPNTNIEYLGSYFGIPFAEHTLASSSYDDLLKMLGKQFQEEYSKKGFYESDPTPF